MGFFGIENQSTAGNLNIKWYGNWGGPGHGEEGDKPIDRLDGYYRDHDHGYGDRGYFDSPSDHIYGINALDVMIDPNTSTDGKLHAVAAVGIFGLTRPLSDLATTTYNPISNVVDDVKKHGFLAGLGHLAVSPVTTAVDLGKKAVKAVGGVLESVGNFLGGLF